MPIQPLAVNMPLIVGIAFTDLKPGSDVFVEVLSSDNLSHTHTILEQIIDSSDLTSTFQIEKIGGSIEALGLGSLHYGDGAFISLTVPTYLSLTDEKIKGMAIQAKSISLLCKGRLPTWTNISSLVTSEDEDKSLTEYEGQYELLLEIGPDSMAYTRLVVASAEEEIRETDCRMESMINLKVENEVGTTDAAAELVDRVLAALSNPLVIQPPLESTYYNSAIEVKDPSLKRVFILDSSPNLVSSEVITTLKAKYTTDKMESFPEIILKTNPGPLLAKYALARSLKSYHNSLRYEAGDMICVFNVAPLRIGIVNADGSITTAIPRNYTLPNTRLLIFTTAKDGQKSATVTVVAGLAPRVEAKDGNIVIAQLSLKGLRPRAKGVHRIHITIDVEHMGRTRIVAREDAFSEDSELEGEGLNGGASASVELRDLCGEIDLEKIENICDTYQELAYDPAADPAVRWAGTDFAGDLPE